MKKFLCYLAVPCMLLGCSGGINTECIVAEIDIDKDYREDVSIFDLVTKVELVQLESSFDAMIDPWFRPFLPVIDQTGMYFMEGENCNYVIKHFNNDGVWIDNINKHGRGNGEFIYAVSYSINPINGFLEVLGPRGTVYRYDLNHKYKFIESLKLMKEPRLNSARMISCNEYLLRAENEEEYDFYIYDTQSKKSLLINPELNVPRPLSSTFFGKESFYTNNGELRCVASCDGSIYTFSEEDKVFLPYFKWNLGKYHLSIDDIEKGKPDKYYVFELSDEIKGKYITEFVFTCETDNQIITASASGENDWMELVYDKKGRRSYCFESMLVDGKFFYPDGVQEDGVLYVVVPPDELKDRVGIDWLTDERSKRVYDYATANPESNSVIIKYYLK